VNDVVPLLGISHFFILSTLGEPQKGHFMIVQYLKLIDVVYNLGCDSLFFFPLPLATNGMGRRGLGRYRIVPRKVGACR
jgi:hypothetical protein